MNTKEFIKKAKKNILLPSVNYEGDLLIGEQDLEQLLDEFAKIKLSERQQTEKSSNNDEKKALHICSVGRNTSMKCLNCQKNYIDDTIIVQYDGLYNYNEMMEYVKRCYGNVKGEVIEHEEPNECQGYKNIGSVLIR